MLRGWHGRLTYVVAAVLGVFCGLSVFTLGYGEGAAYLQNDPAVCANCHVMQWHYDSWLQSSHRDVATCNDCHLLHHPIGKWVTKADNGFFHSLAFTTGGFPDPLRIKPRNRRVTQLACLHCHGELVDAMLPPAEHDGETLPCARCHRAVGHAER